MPDPSYVIENDGRKAGLEFHLSTAFYPPLPLFVRQAFIASFEQYWDFQIDIDDLAQMLSNEAGYVGSLNDYNFWQFLNEEDLDHG